MSEPTINIERLVREVLAELGISKAQSGERPAGHDGQGPKLDPPTPRPAPPVVPDPSPNSLMIDNRVVTMTKSPAGSTECGGWWFRAGRW